MPDPIPPTPCASCGSRTFLIQRVARFEVESLAGGRCECGRSSERAGGEFEDLAWRRAARMVRRTLDEGLIDESGRVRWTVEAMELECEIAEAREHIWCPVCARGQALQEESIEDPVDGDQTAHVTLDVRCAACRRPLAGTLLLAADQVMLLP